MVQKATDISLPPPPLSECPQITNARNEKGHTGPYRHSKILRGLEEQLYANKVENLDKMDKFWKNITSELTQDERENLEDLGKEMESVI